MSWLQPTPDGVTLIVRVVPNASKNQVVGVHAGALKIRLQAPPVEGKANHALILFLAETLHIPRNRINLTTGSTSRHKTLTLTGLTPQEASTRLNLASPD